MFRSTLLLRQKCCECRRHYVDSVYCIPIFINPGVCSNHFSRDNFQIWISTTCKYYSLLQLPMTLPITWYNTSYDVAVWNMNSDGYIQRQSYLWGFVINQIWNSEVAGGYGADAGVLLMQYIHCTYRTTLCSTLCTVMGCVTPWYFRDRRQVCLDVVTYMSSKPQNRLNKFVTIYARILYWKFTWNNTRRHGWAQEDKYG